MKLAIIGSRNYSVLSHVYSLVGCLAKDTEIVSGGAQGVDLAAKKAAEINLLAYKEFPAEWELYGKVAGFRRNSDIVNYCDGLVAFWDGESRGTLDSILKAIAQDKLYFIKTYDPIGISNIFN